jgi:hypothetical protein
MICAAAVVIRDGVPMIEQPHASRGLAGAPRLSSLAGSFAVTRDLFERVGGYDTDLEFGENTDLVIRCAALSSVCNLEAPTVAYRAAPNERHYDERRLRAVERIVDRGRVDLQDPVVRSNLHGIAAVNASRTGRHLKAVRHAGRSFTTKPDLRTLARFTASLSGPVAGRWWRRGQ